MKKFVWFLLPFLLIGCATVENRDVLESEDIVVEKEVIFPWSIIDVKTGDAIYAPVNCGFVFYDSKQPTLHIAKVGFYHLIFTDCSFCNQHIRYL